MNKEMKETVENTLTTKDEKLTEERLAKKKRGDSQIVVTMVLIVIALVLCFLFKDNISTFMTTAITTMTSKMNTLLGNLN